MFCTTTYCKGIYRYSTLFPSLSPSLASSPPSSLSLDHFYHIPIFSYHQIFSASYSSILLQQLSPPPILIYKKKRTWVILKTKAQHYLRFKEHHRKKPWILMYDCEKHSQNFTVVLKKQQRSSLTSHLPKYAHLSIIGGTFIIVQWLTEIHMQMCKVWCSEER